MKLVMGCYFLRGVIITPVKLKKSEKSCLFVVSVHVLEIGSSGDRSAILVKAPRSSPPSWTIENSRQIFVQYPTHIYTTRVQGKQPLLDTTVYVGEVGKVIMAVWGGAWKESPLLYSLYQHGSI